MLQTYLKLSLRNLLKNKLQNGINIIGLSIGITGALVTFLILQHQLNFDGQHSRSDSIFKVVQETHTKGHVDYWSTTCYPLAAALRSDFPGIKTAQTAGPFSRLISYQNELGEVVRFEEDKVLFADANYLDFFDFAKHFKHGLWLEGDPETAFNNPDAVILTADRAERYFGRSDRSVLGKVMLLNNKDPLTVTGIIRNPPDNINLHFDLLVPYLFFKRNNEWACANWAGNYMGTAYLMLPPDESADGFETRINDWKKRYLTPEDQSRIQYRLQALSEVHLDTRYDASPGSYTISKKTLAGLGVMAAFLLMIGCVNFINLATARMGKRAKTVGVSKVLGSSRGQLQRQFLGETTLLTASALLLSFWSSGLVLNWLNNSLSLVEIHLEMQPWAWLFGVLIMGVVVLLAGWYPAFALSGLPPIQGIKVNSTRRPSKVWG